ncbi:hypothetical protein SLEP1_g56565 [Rubroshorea leprosula]|uniref:Uncharacterized protein n=1 Tax=Rubroshorea leprosula TaxID=152421 RepID=A0AAV5MIP8_9ROSI|nr:hypothetical protein SLEP1_g56565 [Rubroshorea leprosula]
MKPSSSTPPLLSHLLVIDKFSESPLACDILKLSMEFTKLWDRPNIGFP